MNLKGALLSSVAFLLRSNLKISHPAASLPPHLIPCFILLFMLDVFYSLSSSLIMSSCPCFHQSPPSPHHHLTASLFSVSCEGWLCHSQQADVFSFAREY